LAPWTQQGSAEVTARADVMLPTGRVISSQHLAIAAASYKARPTRPILHGWVSDCRVTQLGIFTPNPGLILILPPRCWNTTPEAGPQQQHETQHRF
jgi:hypothetical protein